MTDDEKLELYEKFEVDLIIDDSTRKQLELDKVKEEKSDLEKANIILEQVVKEKDELAKKYRDDMIFPTTNKLIIKTVEDFLKKQKTYE